MEHQKYLITGCGRSGTGFYSNLLKHNGISCGHESYINYKGINKHNFVAESSWLAVPFITQLNKNIAICRTIREPISLIKSWHQLSILTDKKPPYTKFIFHHLPEIQKHTELNAITMYYIEWNKMFDKLSKNYNCISYQLDSIVNQDKIIFFNETFINPKKVINTKSHHKLTLNKNINDIINEQVDKDLLDEAFFYYKNYSI